MFCWSLRWSLCTGFTVLGIEYLLMIPVIVRVSESLYMAKLKKKISFGFVNKIGHILGETFIATDYTCVH